VIDIIGKRKWYFLLSGLVILPGIIAMIYSLVTYGSVLRLSVDFTSGTLIELRFDKIVQPADVRSVYLARGYADTSVQSVGDGSTVLIRSKQLDDKTKQEIEAELQQKLGAATELRYQTVGPAVGREVTRAATIAVIVGSLAIMVFIVIAFRGVPNSIRYGVCAIVAMIHDILVTVGVFAIFGLLLGWEADSLFLTALLTMVGFSVQDTIVVFDRIRENVPKMRGESFEVIVNRSLSQTLHRSLATGITQLLVLTAILLLGGATMKQFVAVLIVGMITGAYSSIFNAVPLLVVWENGEIGSLFRRPRSKPATI
jgi:preprotein translocase subunit SecF